MVKSVKFHLRRTVSETVLTSEELSTLLTQIEAILNLRSLEPRSDDPDDISALTAGHFLTGSALSILPKPFLNHLTTFSMATHLTVLSIVLIIVAHSQLAKVAIHL